MVSFGGFGVAQISMLSQVRCSARKACRAYATRVLSVRLFSAPFRRGIDHSRRGTRLCGGAPSSASFRRGDRHGVLAGCLEARLDAEFWRFWRGSVIDAFASPVQCTNGPPGLRRVYCRCDFSAPLFVPTFVPKLDRGVLG